MKTGAASVQVTLAELCAAQDAKAELERLARCLENAFHVLRATPETTQRAEIEQFVGWAIARTRSSGRSLPDCERFAEVRSTPDDGQHASELRIEMQGEWLEFFDHSEEQMTYRLACPERAAEAFARAVAYTPGAPF
jgi:hypothetical protein